jgi:LacI family transcriptional regulator
MANKITIRDVARRAGVSHQTVSRVINNSAKVSENTRRVVREAIRDLNYVPSPLARSFTKHRSHLLGVLVQRLHNMIPATIEGALRAAREKGYQLLIYEFDAANPRDQDLADFLTAHHIEGLYVIFSGSRDYSNSILEEVGLQIPVVTTGLRLARERVVRIPFDNRNGSRIATQHLLGLGHTRIAHVTGPEASNTAALRRAGYESALLAAGHSVTQELIVEADWSVYAGHRAVDTLLANNTRFTAVVAQNDLIAVGCIKALNQHGLNVPRDVAVVGLYDMPFVEFTEPALTTVRYPASHLGRLCVNALIAQVDGDERDPHDLFPDEFEQIKPHLVIRESCWANPPARQGLATQRTQQG